jgi:phage-related protein
MADWFDFAGVRSTSLGVYVEKFPDITLPEERTDFKPIPGRSGSLTLLEGEAVYDDISLPAIECFVRDLSNLDQISAWLRGSGDLVLGNMPNRCYKATLANQIGLSQVMRGRQHRRFPAVFRCSPYRYIHPQPSPKTLTSSPGSIANPGTAEAYPLITIVGSGDVTLTIGDKVLTVSGLASQVTYDTETGFALDGSGNDLTQTVSLGEWPLAIPPGTHAVSWIGEVTSVTITRPWRYI